MDSISDIKRQVEENQGVKTFTMEVLRNALGKGKLGKYVLESISKELASQGLAHLPTELPNYQFGQVRVYLLGSRIADLIEATNTVGEESDNVLKGFIGGDEADILRKVRELVC